MLKKKSWFVSAAEEFSVPRPPDSRREQTFFHLQVDVLSAKNLASKDINGSSDPYCILQCEDTTVLTSVKWKSLSPVWNESFTFKVKDLHAKVHLRMFDKDKLSKDDFMGFIEFSLDDFADETVQIREFELQADPTIDEEVKGSITLRIRLVHSDRGRAIFLAEKLHISFYESFYKTLITMDEETLNMLFSRQAATISPREIQAMVNLILCRPAVLFVDQPAATNHNSLLTGSSDRSASSATAFCDPSTIPEISEQRAKLRRWISNSLEAVVELCPKDKPQTLFRSNSTATQLAVAFMHFYGIEYIYDTLKHFFREIYESDSVLEVDPSRLVPAHSTEEANKIASANLAKLKAIVENLLAAICGSLQKVPAELRWLCQTTATVVEAHFNDERVKQTAVGALVFLRFIVPAITTPTIYDLIPEQPNADIQRSLTLVSKVLMSIANGVQFGYKEPYMVQLNEFVAQNIPTLFTFFSKLSDSCDSLPEISDKPAVTETPRAFITRQGSIVDTPMQRSSLTAPLPPIDERSAEFTEFLWALYVVHRFLYNNWSNIRRLAASSSTPESSKQLDEMDRVLLQIGEPLSLPSQ